MLTELDEQLMDVRKKLRTQQKLRALLSSAQHTLEQERDKLGELENDLSKESQDVEKLKGMSLTGLFYIILGSKEMQLKKERQELLVTKLRYDECLDAVSATEREVAEIEEQLAEFEDLAERYQSLLDQKEKLLVESGGEEAQRLREITERLAGVESDLKESQEAVDAGRAVLAGLDDVRVSLKSASNWGAWDVLGGGMLATAVKHSKIDDARNQAHHVQQLLRRFQWELEDIEREAEIAIKIGSFETFADFFFDGLIFDWVVQSRINNSLENVAQVESRVLEIVESLQDQVIVAQKELVDLGAERTKLIEAM